MSVKFVVISFKTCLFELISILTSFLKDSSSCLYSESFKGSQLMDPSLHVTQIINYELGLKLIPRLNKFADVCASSSFRFSFSFSDMSLSMTSICYQIFLLQIELFFILSYSKLSRFMLNPGLNSINFFISFIQVLFHFVITICLALPYFIDLCHLT